MEDNKAKRCQFYGQLYTGDNADMKTTSFRAPVGLLKDIATVCEHHNRKSQNEFIHLALLDRMAQQLLEDRGGIVLKIENPQQYAEPNEDTRAEVAQIMAEIAALKIDQRLGFRTGVNDLINFLFERLCKENTGDAWATSDFYARELDALKKNKE